MNIAIIETAKAAWVVIGPIVGGTGIWAYLRSRAPKSSSPSQIIESQAYLVTAVNLQTKTILAENAKLRRESNRDIRVLKIEVRKFAAQVADCQSKHIECELKADELKIRVEELMRTHAPATYDTLNRVGPKDL